MTDQGSAYADFIAAELGRELDRRDNMTAQAMSLVTTAGGLLTLSIGVLAVLRGKNFVPTRGAQLVFLGALVLYLAAGVLALMASISRRYKVASGDTLTAMLNSHWTDTEQSARFVTAFINIRSVGSLRTGNNTKALLLLVAAVAQIAAVVVLALGLWLVYH